MTIGQELIQELTLEATVTRRYLLNMKKSVLYLSYVQP